ncbi:MAG TPA: hypothetical protein VEP50_02080 [bacterium]|nr:hypothetical protein [bacterium]
MTGAVLVVLACAAAAFVLAPLWRPGGLPAWEAERERLLAARDAAYRALREVELDRETGKLGDADYAALRARYRAEAAAVLRRLDALALSGASVRGRGQSDAPGLRAEDHPTPQQAAPEQRPDGASARVERRI